MDVLITLTTAGADTGPFNLFSNVDSYTTAFATGVAKSALVAGYLSTAVPASTNYIRVKSTGRCTNYIDIFVTGSATTTTTTTSGPGTTTTTTTQVVTYYNVVLCGTSTPSVIRHNGPNNVTLGVVVQSSNGQCYTVSSVGTGPETVGTLLTQFASCVLCQGAPPPTTTTTTTATPTTTTTTTASPTTTTTTTAGLYRVWNLYRSEGATNPACSTTPATQVIAYNSNYAPGVVFKASNGFCYTIANDGYQVTAPLITLDDEFGNCTECTETSPTTTTTTTSAPITYEYYFASEYLCGNCDTPTATDVLVKFVTGTVVTPNRFYKEINPTNYVYQITNTSQGIGIAYTLITPTYNTCEDACNLPAPTTTTTAPPTTTTTTTANTSYYTFSMTAGYATSGEVCLEGSSVTQIYGSNATFLSNTYFYNSPSLSSPYVGNGLFYKNTNTNQWVQIEFDGFNNGGGSC